MSQGSSSLATTHILQSHAVDWQMHPVAPLRTASIIRITLSFLWMPAKSGISCCKLYLSDGRFKRNADDTHLSSCSSAFTGYRTGCLFSGLLQITWDKRSSQLFWWGFYKSVKSTHDLLLCNHFTENIMSKNKLKLTQDMEKTIRVARATATNICVLKQLSHISQLFIVGRDKWHWNTLLW